MPFLLFIVEMLSLLLVYLDSPMLCSILLFRCYFHHDMHLAIVYARYASYDAGL